jgi:hypothetical protein
MGFKKENKFGLHEAWNKDKKLSEDHIQSLKETWKIPSQKRLDGIKRRAEKIRGKPSWNKGLKGNLSHVFGHIVSEETRKKIGNANRGEKNGMFGKPSPRVGVCHTEASKQKNREKHLGTKQNLSEETKQKKREVALRNLPALLASDKNWDSPDRNRKISESKKLQWQDIEWKERVLKKVFASNEIKPNKAEFYTDSLIQTARPTDFIYSGNGEIFIGGKCPDWFNVNGKKQVIELFGNYFHSKLVTGRTKKQEEKQRINHFAKYGYQTLIIWESELKNPDKLTQKIQNF